jgi:phage/plasmid-like protein (TIGR03299 family)
MGHNLNETDGQFAMMYVGEVPWHKLGTKLDHPATAEEAIEAASLNFTVEKLPLKTEALDLPVQSHFATVRTDTNQVLGVVGSRYVPIQNEQAFTTFDALVGEGEAIYHTAGALGKGERIWLLAKLPDYIRVKGNDLVEKFLLLTNSHDGSSVVRVKLTPVRVVCENTLSLALSGVEQEVRIRHTAHASERMKEAHEILGLTNKLYEELDLIFNQMSSIRIDGRVLTDYVKKVFPDPPTNGHIHRKNPIREKVFELAHTGKGADLAPDTLWNAYNAVTEYVDYYRQVSADESTRLKSIWFGSGERIKKHAFKLALDMVQARN